MYLLGCDIGSSSVKASIVNSENGRIEASEFYPAEEAPIRALQPGWAEQDPNDWWEYLRIAVGSAVRKAGIRGEDVRAIGISYQMHGLTLVDKQLKTLRPAIIWCDSRAVTCGEQAFEALGKDYCLSHLLNTPGNFTAAKLAWVKENEPRLFDSVYKFLLPGDFIAMRMTGETLTTVSGLSEGIFWDFKENHLSHEVMNHFGFPEELVPGICPTFGRQGELTASAASALGLSKGTPVTYRAGDQPNNALSLNVFNPGEIAATAGTSGVVYGVNGSVTCDPLSRVNTFAHVNHSDKQTRLGVLLCINGAGILNSWVKRNLAPMGGSYEALNRLAATVPIGSEGVTILPFGNGTERMLENREADCSVYGINFNLHDGRHLARAAQEGIVCAFRYGMDILKEMGMDIRLVRAGHANMFLSPVFRETLAGTTGAVIELYDTNGAAGAALGAGLGAGIYASPAEAFASLRKIEAIEADTSQADAYDRMYARWKTLLINHSSFITN
ncbi:MAG: carbohydrate kinase [Tannerellaceae bacterium]|jgi:xylulokinase|nr:carbohydrate kinase [Tannerellaceae bacterium]